MQICFMGSDGVSSFQQHCQQEKQECQCLGLPQGSSAAHHPLLSPPTFVCFLGSYTAHCIWTSDSFATLRKWSQNSSASTGSLRCCLHKSASSTVHSWSHSRKINRSSEKHQRIPYSQFHTVHIGFHLQ